MFKFGFSSDETDDSEGVTGSDFNEEETSGANLNEKNEGTQDEKHESKPYQKIWLKCEEITIRNNHVPEELLTDEFADALIRIGIGDSHEIKHVSPTIVADLVQKRKDANDSIFKAEQNHSDLVTAVYEGGLKVWQCTYDLLEYIFDNEIQFKGKKVLDLGCGAGILGIYAFINGAKVYFQDYNPEVIRYITIPNVLLNEDENNEAKSCRFYSGDWKSFFDLTIKDFPSAEEKFDYILSSETIYNCDNYTKLHLIFKDMLKNNGIIYLTAKTYYFGVGGGTRQFEETLKNSEIFDFETSWSNTEGVQREILKLTFK